MLLRRSQCEGPIMMNLPTAEACSRAARQPVEAKTYQQSGALPFVESSTGEAHEIAQPVGSPFS